MKKLLITLAAVFFCLEGLAIPAMPGAFTYKQPDGSIVRLERHGDEFFSWTTLAGSSQVMVLGADGFWKKGRLSESAFAAAQREREKANRERALQTVVPYTHDNNPMTHGERHIPVLLVAFKDVGFSIADPQSKFNQLLNQNGYSFNQATGSVQDYYLENSDGQFKPIFDVYGPVTLPNDMIYYGEPVKDDEGNIIRNDIRASEALRDGCDLLDSVIDFSKYDYDNDGRVDMTLFYYAGYNTAEGGSENAIWPHQSSLGGNATYDGKIVSRYFCTSELQGTSGSTMCQIGTTCHEFGHSLGLPDFYDTDYEKNGKCAGMDHFSIMSSGSYNNGSRTPPYFNTEERIILGWMSEDDVRRLEEGLVSIGPVRNTISYKCETGIRGEYFLFECRDATGWDAPLPAGLWIYHVDKSPDHMVGPVSAYTQWANWSWYNTLNAYGDHPCFYIVPAVDQDNLNYKGDYDSFVFPGSGDIHGFSPVDWDGNNLSGTVISGISYADGTVQLTTTFTKGKTVAGRVTDLIGYGIPGVLVQVTSPAAAAAPTTLKLQLGGAAPRSIDQEIFTDENGYFTLIMDGFDEDRAHITLSRSGYQTAGYNVDLTERYNNVGSFAMSRRDQGKAHTYSYYDLESGMTYLGSSGQPGASLAAAICIPAGELPENGGILTTVSLHPHGTAARGYYLIVEQGDERLLTEEFTPEVDLPDFKFQVLELEAFDVNVKGGEDLFVGYAVAEADSGFPFTITKAGNNFYWSNFYLDEDYGVWWYPLSDYALYMEALVVEKRDPGEDPEITSLAQMGIPAIADPSCGDYVAGDSFQLQLALPEGVSPASEEVWLFDGTAVTGAKSVTLTAGRHVVTARVKWSDGSQETMSLALDVK